MTLSEPLRLKGAPGSPYTRKMIAYMRYRHIRYEFFIGDPASSLGLPRPKVELLPTFYLPNERGEIEAVVDSTPLIRRFETEFSGRETIPGNPVAAFLNYLIEDYADEWLTKAMFHYRWYYDDDIHKAGAILPRWRAIQASDEQLKGLSENIARRQIDRLYVVGSNDITAPVIEDSYLRFLDIMDKLIEKQGYVLGSRPASADFGIYAQMTQLSHFDPTPSAICLQRALRVYAWTDRVDDLSGHQVDDSQWADIPTLADNLRPFLTEIGKVYAPALLANAQAVMNGEKDFSTTIDGKPWSQPAFPYQAKCLMWIREAWQSLNEEHRSQVNEILAGTGADSLLQA
ncbi:MAG: glutathione S-transferase N-terminal domain-containing protein [Pseudomonadales bacterium]|nr:glutathione S-transferase N-terminal domain-containing protein [Pseudomonadales bacterium]